MSQPPSIARIVHYHSYGTPGGEYLPEPRAAIITAVGGSHFLDGDDGEPGGRYVSLAVLNPTGLFFDTDVPFSEEPKPGHWSWPPHVPKKGDDVLNSIIASTEVTANDHESRLQALEEYIATQPGPVNVREEARRVLAEHNEAFLDALVRDLGREK